MRLSGLTSVSRCGSFHRSIAGCVDMSFRVDVSHWHPSLRADLACPPGTRFQRRCVQWSASSDGLGSTYSIVSDTRSLTYEPFGVNIESNRAMITGAQIRAACGMLKWSARELADTSGLSLSTVKRMQAADGVPSVAARSLEAIQRTLEDAGIGFTNGEEPGVKLRQKPRRPAGG